jgi:flagellar basal body-associated protein FliL
VLAFVAVVGVILLAAAAGLGVAWLLTGAVETPANQPQAQSTATEEDRYEYVEFGDIVANLAEGRATRYVKVNVTLQVPSEDAPAVRKLVDGEKKAVFQDWLLTYLSDKQLEEVTGGTALAKLRRDIQDGFNAVLAEHGEERVEGVLFTEFNIQ